MDEEKKNQIKIKINGEDKEFKEELIIHDWKAKREVAATEERAIPLLKNKKKKRPAFPKGRNHPAIIISSISAIVIGILIGIILLQFMTKDVNENEQGAQTVSSNSTTTAGNEQVILPAVSLYILQQGAYKSQESVDKIIQDYKKENQPVASINTGDNIRVFIAVTDTLDTGKQMRETEFYKNTFTETWPTKLEVNEKVIQHLTGDEKTFLESAYPIYEKLVVEGTKAFLQDDQNINMNELTSEIDKIKNYKKLQKKPVQELQKNLIHAYEALNGYSKDRNIENWQKLQKYLLTFVSSYYLF
ncbi:hypothetical protein NST54_12680 [Caldifermentibacillus hisashii]|uniref:hypothetical protein n=1 Tax=Caldifermentibacillus hisashii TaxID=996558 RepID=UPI0034D60BC5